MDSQKRNQQKNIKDKKVGILTFHCAHNYGAVLQCYALQTFLSSIGCKVYVINYRPSYLTKPYQLFERKRIFTRNPWLLLLHVYQEIRYNYPKWHSFNKFIRRRLHLTKQVGSSNIPNTFDTYVYGSDQIWNYKITKGYDPVYFATWKNKPAGRRHISYAASMETTTISPNHNAELRSLLENYDAISVREEVLKLLLSGITSKNINCVLDPTLLVDSSMWRDLASPHIRNQKYVLIYQIKRCSDTLRIAAALSKSLNAQVIDIDDSCYSPESFLGLFRSAECIVTTSFHGTAFSVIFKRPFYTIQLGAGSDSRSIELLKHIGLENRLISKNDTPLFSLIDYEPVDNLLNTYRETSINYIMNNI